MDGAFRLMRAVNLRVLNYDSHWRPPGMADHRSRLRIRHRCTSQASDPKSISAKTVSGWWSASRASLIHRKGIPLRANSGPPRR